MSLRIYKESFSILRTPKVYWKFRYHSNVNLQQPEKGIGTNISTLNAINGEDQIVKLLSFCLSYHVISSFNKLEQDLTNHFL